MIACRKAAGGDGFEALRILKRRFTELIYYAVINGAYSASTRP